MPHLDEGTIHALLDGELTPEETAAAESHLAACEACRALHAEASEFFAESEVLIESLDVPGGSASAAPAAPTAPAWFRRPQVLALAATVTVAIGASFIAYRSLPDADKPFAQPAATEPDAGIAGGRELDLLEQAAESIPAADQAKQSESELQVAGAMRRSNTPVPTDGEGAPAPAVASGILPEEGVPAQGGKDDADRKEQLAEVPAAPAPERDRVEAPAEERARPRADDDPDAAKRGAAAANEVADAPARTGEAAGFDDVVSTLGGSIRLIDGKQAIRYERVALPELAGVVRGDLVRVYYQDDQDREIRLEQLRLAEANANARRQLLEDRDAEAAAAGARAGALDLRAIEEGDTVVSRDEESEVRIRWLDGDFLLALVGWDEAYLRSLMEQIR